MSFGAAVKLGFANYATFSGRSRRSEFWWWYLFLFLISIPVYIVGVVLFGASFVDASTVTNSDGVTQLEGFNAGPAVIGTLIMFVFWLAFVLPTLAVMTRRLHDMGQSGLWILLSLIGLGIVPLIMCLLETQPGTNQYGADPKANARSLPANSGYAVPPVASTGFAVPPVREEPRPQQNPPPPPAQPTPPPPPLA